MLDQTDKDTLLSPTQLATRVGCNYSHIVKFIKAGMLMRRSNGAGAFHLSRKEVAAFIAPLERVKFGNVSANFVSMIEQYYATRRSICEVYQSVIDGQIKSAKRSKNKIGLTGLMLDPQEVRSLFMNTIAVPGITKLDFLAKHGISPSQFADLVGLTGLRIVKSRSPDGNLMKNYVIFETVEAFEKQYVSIREIARQTGINSQTVRRKLAEAGIRPVPMLSLVGKFYLVSDLDGLYRG